MLLLIMHLWYYKLFVYFSFSYTTPFYTHTSPNVSRETFSHIIEIETKSPYPTKSTLIGHFHLPSSQSRNKNLLPLRETCWFSVASVCARQCLREPLSETRRGEFGDQARISRANRSRKTMRSRREGISLASVYQIKILWARVVSLHSYREFSPILPP